jgi:uncharacterized caspase-like protein
LNRSPYRAIQEQSFLLSAVLALVALLADTGPTTAAERRVALVIGNAAYAHANALKAPVNDARLVAKTLREIGFTEVLEHYNVGLAPMAAALDTFGVRAGGADWAVIYYAGHGLEVGGVSYLVPTDARLANASELARETITLGRLLEKPVRTQKLRLLILDTPRNNPFGVGARSSPAGKEPSAEGDVFIAFATGPGKALAESVGDTPDS